MPSSASGALGILAHHPGPVPLRQIVGDLDEDGIYDRYIHSKVMAVSGWYRRTERPVAWQGSENWSGLANSATSRASGSTGRRRGRLRPLGGLPVQQPAAASTGGDPAGRRGAGRRPLRTDQARSSASRRADS